MHNIHISLYTRVANMPTYRVLVSLAFMIGFFGTEANANFESTATSTAAACPINHKMYFIGANANAPASTPDFPVVSLPLNWTAGDSSRNFTFAESSGNKTFNINFSSIVEKNNSQGAPPFYGSINGSTSSAINLVHDSTSTVNNHILNISTNRSVSKAGYEIQDVDSLTSNVIIGYIGFFPIRADRTPYAEQIDVSANGGRLTFNSLFHAANNPAPNTSIVTAIEGQNCSTGECDIDASWGYKAANSVLGLRHNNTINETPAPHAVGYSNFYFCLAPPKVLVKKVLAGNRVNDTDTNRDQFELSINRGTTVVNAVTTTGSGSAVTNNNNRNAVSIAENTSYTITERVRNGTTLGEIANYNATYTCTNATTGSTTVMPTANMVFNATTKTRSFTLASTNFGDEITCTITNTPIGYTFSGTVFDDNGGITDSEANATNADIASSSSPYANRPNYFNGVFNTPQELGIAGSTVKLVNCTAPSTVYATQAVSTTGTYQINASAATINSNSNNICLVEERAGTDYPIRTNAPTKTVNIVTNTFDYPNNNFGRVIAANVALVLKKSQYINNCPATLNYASIGDTTSPSTGFSSALVENIAPGRCIAYKITATNRANVNIDNFVMKDILQNKGVNNAIVTSTIAAPAPASTDYTANSPTIGQNGTMESKSFTLNPRTKRDFYFNTKYGTSQ
ncbi:hypothetical protein [Psychrobacter sp. DM4]|uniref:hypothetical protein n=1 Tax=Psychrobacter sp. DM4 TaxID=3440637 RepID=UPI003F5071B1